MKTKIPFLALLLFFTSTLMLNAQTSDKAKLVDMNEEKHSSKTLDDILKKYKGKVIYLDFWASWCGPCKREMPYSSQLKKKYNGKDVAFVYISTDKNASKWEMMIEQMGLVGDHYRASNKIRMELFERFNLQYIPRYMLINREGKVADDNAKRPSDPMISGDIDKLLL
ncbi:MAG: TlpA family protein disulfide reductase [bacterium]